jgi:glycosyltransferase involved in cell wall biosynthesis
MLTISIVTPSFNQRKYIEECLLSVKRQSSPAFEHIVVDGASTDGTLEIFKDYSSRPGWEHLRWVSEPDQGQSDALNKGFGMATGDIVGWLNSDDAYTEGCVATVARVFSSRPEVDVLYGDYNWIDESGHILQVRREIDFNYFILLYNRICFIQSSSALFLRRKIFEQGHFLDKSFEYSMDYEFYVRLATLGYCFAHVKEVLGSFRWHHDSKSALFPEKQAQEWKAVREKYAPASRYVNGRTSRYLTTWFLVRAATVLRWIEKAARGYYFERCSSPGVRGRTRQERA